MCGCVESSRVDHLGVGNASSRFSPTTIAHLSSLDILRRPHYGTEFRVELIDATTDKPVGTCLLTTQGLAQQQRDFLVEEKRVPFLSFLRPIRFEGTRRLVMELRAGFKSGFSSTDYYSADKGGASSDGEIKPGRYSTWHGTGTIPIRSTLWLSASASILTLYSLLVVITCQGTLLAASRCLLGSRKIHRACSVRILMNALQDRATN